MSVTAPIYEIGIDTGGTFTDLVCWGSDGSSYFSKIPSTPDDPGAAVLAAVDRLVAETDLKLPQVGRFVHGTTVATNAIIEKSGAKTGLLATQGFRDILEIGRQMRRGLYDIVLLPETPVFLAPRYRRKGVRERVTADGTVLVPLDEDCVRTAVSELLEAGVEAIAVSYLFSFLHPEHELRTRVDSQHPMPLVEALVDQ